MVFNRIKDFCSLSLCDWPGHPCPVVFLGGCNLACGTCHNAKLAWDDKEIESIEVTDLLNMLHARKGWYHGITITGGEPTIHKDLPDLLAMIKENILIKDENGNDTPIKIKVDSNGTRPEMVRYLIETGLADVMAVDIKGPWHMYPQLTNHTFSALDAEMKIGEILAMSQEYPGRIYFRCTKVPALTRVPGMLEMVKAVVPDGVELRFQDFVDPESTCKSTVKETVPVHKTETNSMEKAYA